MFQQCAVLAHVDRTVFTSDYLSFVSTNMAKTKAKVCLLVHDGWGVARESGKKGNAIEAAETPAMTSLSQDKNNAYTLLEAHGLAVGLNDGLMGNSEVG